MKTDATSASLPFRTHISSTMGRSIQTGPARVASDGLGAQCTRAALGAWRSKVPNTWCVLTEVSCREGLNLLRPIPCFIVVA